MTVFEEIMAAVVQSVATDQFCKPELVPQISVWYLMTHSESVFLPIYPFMKLIPSRAFLHTPIRIHGLAFTHILHYPYLPNLAYIFYSESEGSTYLQTVNKHLPHYVLTHYRNR
jgi:hypothetical protein